MNDNTSSNLNHLENRIVDTQDEQSSGDQNNEVSTNNVSNSTNLEFSTENTDKEKLPDTGEVKSNDSTLLATLLAGLGSIFLFGRRRKSQNKE
ncbi:LPXTG cell wall anchor domain-containing protein [Mammaliicoccus fleurettii]|uniref:LPXTG cell wall anchor domain-containing protein n=1 Tax=Mammaliicoccus fleurettii TaxID=150056 RepID=UPI00115491DA|nr:LPXTG cell wall anchor domain-containing protein [Mammaliicoccus fleurettii]